MNKLKCFQKNIFKAFQTNNQKTWTNILGVWIVFNFVLKFVLETFAKGAEMRSSRHCVSGASVRWLGFVTRVQAFRGLPPFFPDGPSRSSSLCTINILEQASANALSKLRRASSNRHTTRTISFVFDFSSNIRQSPNRQTSPKPMVFVKPGVCHGFRQTNFSTSSWGHGEG